MSRAQDWTTALTRWCESQTGLVQFAGVCRLHRSELLQLHGDWAGAIDEVQCAVQRITAGHPAVGLAHYQQAELHRLRGEFGLAEAAYQLASRCGRDPHPGLALMWLARGEVDAAVAAIARLHADQHDPGRAQSRPPHWRTRLRRVKATTPEVLSAVVEIMLAAGDVDAARRAADELVELAAVNAAPVVGACWRITRTEQSSSARATLSLPSTCCVRRALGGERCRHRMKLLAHRFRSGSPAASSATS